MTFNMARREEIPAQEVPQPEDVETNSALDEAAWNGVGMQFYSNANLVSINFDCIHRFIVIVLV